MEDREEETRGTRDTPREKRQPARGERRESEDRPSEFELLKPNEQSIPCQLAKSCQERTRLYRDKRSDLAAQSATSSSTGGPTMKSRIIIMSVRTYSQPVSPCPPRERNTTRDTKHRSNLFTRRHASSYDRKSMKTCPPCVTLSVDRYFAYRTYEL